MDLIGGNLMVKLTEEFIKSKIDSPKKGNQYFYRDDDISGFAVRVTLKSKAYVLEKRVAGKNRRMTIGKCNEMSLTAAKKQACIMLGHIEKGNDPVTGKRIQTKNDITLREVLEVFLVTKRLRKATRLSYVSLLNCHLEDWLDKPITAITKDMVERRHNELTATPSRRGTSGHGRANNVLKKLSALVNFAADRFGTDDEPLIKSNPVDRLSKDKLWNSIHSRQRIISDRELKVWYRAVCALKHQTARDFMLFLLLSGMRVGETQQLQWSYVDFKTQVLIVPREITKADREHRLPLSEFLVTLLKRRHTFRGNSEWIFQSDRNGRKHICGTAAIVRRVRAISGVDFSCHDLRRTFLTMGEKLDVPHYTLKRLVNHSIAKDVTGGYLVLDIERLRSQMSRITDAFLELLDVHEPHWQTLSAPESIETIQLKIPFEDLQIL